MQRADQVRAVVLGHVRPEREGLRDVGVVGLVVLALDGVDVDPVIAHQVRGDVVLGGERVGGAEGDLGAGGPERRHQVGGLGGDVQAGGQPGALERLLLGEAGPDLPQHRHGPLGPLGPSLALVRQADVTDVVFRDFGLHAHELLIAPPTADPSRGRCAPR